MDALRPLVGVEETRYGFKWGALEVARTASDPKYGYVVMVSSSKGATAEVRVSPSGEVLDVYMRDRKRRWATRMVTR